MIVQHSRLLCPGGDGNIQSQRREKPYGKQNTRRIQTMTNKAKTYHKHNKKADTAKPELCRAQAELLLRSAEQVERAGVAVPMRHICDSAGSE